MDSLQILFDLIWMVFAVTSANKSTTDKCTSTISVSLNGSITAQAGLCVVLQCSVQDDVQSMEWYKCDQSDKCSKLIFSSKDQNNIQTEFKGQMSLLESDLNKRNCSIIINNLTTSDSGLYHVRVEGKNTCKVEAKVNVTVLNQKPNVMIPPLTEGQQTTLTCTAPGFCFGNKPEITWMWRGAEEEDTQIKGNITHFISDSAVTERYTSTLTFNVSAGHHNTNITCKISFSDGTTTEETKTLQVAYLKISGNLTVNVGDALNLSCTAGSFPATSIKWTKSGSDKSLHEENRNETQTSFGPVYLNMDNVTADDSGQYICTAANQNTTLTAQAEIAVKFVPKILNKSSCHNKSEVLTCVCVSEGFPPPTITWPELEGRTSYSVLTNVSKSRVTSTLTVSMKDLNIPIVMCVSSNDAGTANHSITTESQQKNFFTKLLKTFEELDWYFLLLTGFVFGTILTATITCCAVKCHRQKRSRNLDEDLEMVSTQAAPKVEAEYDGIQDQETAEAGAESAGQSAPNGDVEPKEAEYSDLDFSMMKHRNPPEAQEAQETTETEYAEIKKEGLEERQQNGEEDEILQVNDEEGAIITENETPKESVLSEEVVGEDVPLYSDVNDVLNET